MAKKTEIDNTVFGSGSKKYLQAIFDTAKEASNNISTTYRGKTEADNINNLLWRKIYGTINLEDEIQIDSFWGFSFNKQLKINPKSKEVKFVNSILKRKIRLLTNKHTQQDISDELKYTQHWANGWGDEMQYQDKSGSWQEGYHNAISDFHHRLCVIKSYQEQLDERELIRKGVLEITKKFKKKKGKKNV